MSQPASKDALPSLADFKHAKKATNEPEDALKDAPVVLEQAQSRATALKESEERTAWIAPVGKLASEILSKIFIFGSEMEHLAPVTISEVSRLWRAVVLATPQAWSLIYVGAPEHKIHLDKYVSAFLQRSNPCLLHIWIRDDLLDYDTDSDESGFESLAHRVLPFLRASLSRIRCLSIGSGQLRKFSKECMPNLARLRITGVAEEVPPLFISRDQFPRLQSIQSAHCLWGDPLRLTSLPPLRELAIQIDDRSTWLDVVKNCSATLKSLTLVGELIQTERVTIIFPQLQSLALSNWTEGLEEWSISMVTPSLISYDEFSPPTTSFRLRHGDVKSVIYLRSNHLPDLEPYTSLRVLRSTSLYGSHLAYAEQLAEQLKRDINTASALELVEFRLWLSSEEEDPELESTKRDILEQIKPARPEIEVSFVPTLSPMPGSIEESSCKSGMPCLHSLYFKSHI